MRFSGPTRGALLSLLAFAFILSATVFTFAQVTTGSIQGVVRDPNGALVSGAAVTVTNVNTGISSQTTTNSDGFYRVTNLNPGQNYSVAVVSTGFAGTTVERVNVRLGIDESIDVQLGLQGAAGTVTVTAGDAALIQTTQNQLSTSYSPRQIQELPYNGGSIDNLALLTPGVITPGDADFTNGVGISANGNRGRSNNFQLDGQDNNDNSVAGPTLTLTNTEAVGDYQITTNNPSAEFGRNAGAQVNVITRSGTNDFHGSLFEFFQNNKLDARNNIEKQAAQAYSFLARNGFPELQGLANRNGQNVFTYHRFGGAIGGPIIKNRAFFFATFQRDHQFGEADTNNLGSGGFTFTRGSVAAAVAAGLPGARQILGNTNVGGGPTFAQGVGQIIVVPALQDTNGDGVVDAFVNGVNSFGNRLTVAEILCNGPLVGGMCPVANRVPLFTGEAIRIAPNNYRESQFITREDIQLTDKDSIVGRYIFDKTNFPGSVAAGSFLSGAFFDVPSRNDNLGATWTRIFNPRLTNEARFNYSYLRVNFGDPQGTLPAPGITFNGQRDIAGNFTSLGFGTANNLPQSRIVKVYQEQDTVRTTLGNHSLSFGVDLRQQRVDNFFLPNFLGVYRFGSGGTLPANTFFNASGTPRTSGTAFENLLLARPNRINFALGNPRIKTSQNDYFLFIQDDYRVRSNLTLNLGLRYEYSSTPFNPIIDRINAREADPTTAIFNTAFPLEFRTAQKLKTDKNNFAPRVGFAYTPNLKWLGSYFENKQTVLRAGFGIAYDPSFFNIVLNTVTAAPFAAAGQVTQTPGAPGSVTFPFLPSTTAQLNTTPNTNGGDVRLFNQTRVDPGFYNPYTMQWNAGIQQEVWKNSVFEVRYVGSRIIGQFQTVNANPNVRFLNNIASCFGLTPGTFSGGVVVGTSAGQSNDCAGAGFQNRPGTNGNGRVDPNFGSVRLRTNGATATYNGLQTRFDTRFSNVVFNANYTFSKTIDNASEIFSTFGGGQSVAIPQNPFDSTVGERGLSAFSQKHNFTANFIYESPFYREQKGLVGKLLGGYQVSGIVRLASGRPYTPIVLFGSYDTGFDGAFISGVGPLRPYNGNSSAAVGTIAFGYAAACDVLFGGPECDYNGGAAVPGSFIIYNTLQPGSTGTVVSNIQAALQQSRLIYNDAGLLANFGLAATDLEALRFFRNPYGNVGRNTFFGGNFYNVNLAVFKKTRLTERYTIEFRAEASNLFNQRNFGVPDAFTEDASFGNFVGSFQNPGFNAGGNRSLRFGLRFLF